MFSDFVLGIAVGASATTIVAIILCSFLFTIVVPHNPRRMVRILLAEMDRPLRWSLRDNGDSLVLSNADASLTLGLTRKGLAYHMTQLSVTDGKDNDLMTTCTTKELALLRKQAAILYREVMDLNMQMPLRVVQGRQGA